ncbi:MAG: TIGR01459 family HAD-type hydrolase, partial [Alphaproteobacteria bacterium]|nr:TIGR01459 family HAD-type hydrolase [Alphaproteobacteria bacterium]
MTPTPLAGMAQLVGRYDGAILDLWGVLHDGENPMAGAVDCLEHLRGAGWRLVLLSNAPRRAASVAEQVAGFGIPPEAYDGIVTSGDLTRAALASPDAWHQKLGPKFYHLGPARDWGLLDGLPFDRVAEPADCD